LRTRSARRLPAAAVTVAVMTGTVALAPAASAQTPEPTPSTSTAWLNAAETGGVTILKKDPGGDVLAGASFILLDSAGQQAASGKTDVDGQLAFKDLAPGVYRLKEVSSGSPLHDVVDDQDVIVTPGADAPLTITDPFKPATVTLKAKDSKSGKLLPGSTVNIGTGDRTVLLGQTDQGTRRIRPLQALAHLHREARQPGHRDRHQRQDHHHDTDAQLLRGVVRQADHCRAHAGPVDPGHGRQHVLPVLHAVRHRGCQPDGVEQFGPHCRGRARPHWR
jgi:hypothetical protein